MQLKGYLYAAFSAISFGLIPLFIVPANRAGIPLDLTLFYRFMLAAVCIGVFQLLRKQSLRIHRKDFFKLIIMGVLYALSAELLFLGYDVMSPGIASTVLYIYPIIVALILFFGYGEKIFTSTKIAIVLALIGVIILSWEGDKMQFNWWGSLIVLGSSISYASYMIIVSKGKLKASGITVTFYSVLFSSFFYALKLLFLHQSLAVPSAYWLGFYTVFSLVTVVVSVLFIVMAIQLIGSTPTAVLGALEPVIAVGVSVLFLGEKATPHLMIGLIIILAALFVDIIGAAKRNKR